MISSTLSMSVFPKDKRKISQKMRALYSKDQLQEYIDEKNAFLSMVKENDYQSAKVRDKDKDYRDNYLKSFVHKSEFKTRTLSRFKMNTMQLNANVKLVP